MTKLEKLHNVYFKSCNAYDKSVVKADELSWAAECAGAAVGEAWATRHIAHRNWLEEIEKEKK